MVTEPVTLFAQLPAPRLVIDVLRKMHAKFKLVGPEDAWSEIVVTTGWLKKKQLKITHDPSYYTGQKWQAQMQGMRGYFSRFPNVPEQARVLALTGQFGFVLGTICVPQAEAGDERYAILSAIAEALDAVWFTPSSLRDAQGRFLYGASGLASDAGARWPAYTPATPIAPVAEMPDSEARDLKQRVFSELGLLGFQPASSLPLPDLHSDLRAASTLCRRLMALHAVFAWAGAPEHAAESAPLLAYIERSKLRASMTESERALIDLPRDEARERHAGTVGWKLENMWALAWIVGFREAPALDASQIPDAIIEAMLFGFLPGWDGNAADFAASVALRPVHEVIYMEYKFYCAHNAVRSAQLGGATVPADFDPIAHGGAVHERRHALTWSLAPGVDWDETDLST
jgi:hypothetical protein